MYRLNDEQNALIDRVTKVADAVIGPNAAAVDREGTFPRAGIDALAADGLLGLTVPAEYGGLGQGMRTAVAALDVVGQRCASTGMVTLMHLCGVACYAAAAGSSPDADDALRAVAAGRHLSTLAWSEKGSRSHFWAPVSQAAQEGDRVTLTALKSWVTSAGQADGYVVSTRAPGGAAPTDSTLYLVVREDAGFEVAGPWDSLGMRGNASAPMNLKECEIGAGRALSEPGQGFPRMMEILPCFALGNAAISVGIAEAAVQSTTKHLTGQGFEHLGGSALAELPNLRARLAQMRIETDKARAHLGAILDAVEAGDPAAQLLVLEAKPAASDAAMRVTDLAMQACGGAAFSRHLSVERNFRDARAASVMAPTSDVLHDFIGKALCGMPLF